MLRPGRDFIVLFFALLRAGVVPVIVDPGIGRRNLTTCLAEAKPDAFIGAPLTHAARALFGWTPKSVRIHISVGGRFPLQAVTLDAIEQAGARAREFAFPDTSPDDTAAILFTSGSTGISKGVVYEHANFAAQLEMLRVSYGIEPGEIDVPTFAPFALFDAALGVTTVLPQMDFSRPAGLKPPSGLTGINLLDNEAMSSRKAVFGVCNAIHNMTVGNPDDTLKYLWCIEGDWKLLLRYQGKDTSKYRNLHIWDKAPMHLYNLKEDPHEKNEQRTPESRRHGGGLPGTFT